MLQFWTPGCYPLSVEDVIIFYGVNVIVFEVLDVIIFAEVGTVW